MEPRVLSRRRDLLSPRRSLRPRRVSAISSRRGREGQDPAPVRPRQGRSAAQQSRGHPGQRRAALAPVLRECGLWRRVHARRRLRASREPVQPDRRARQLYDPGLQAHRSGVHRASSVPPPRLRCRSSVAGARRHKRPSTASGWARRQDDRTDFDFQQPYGSATLTFWPTRRLLMLRGGVELSQWSQRPG